MNNLTLKILEGEYSIHRFNPESGIPANILQADYFFIGKTDEELSIVCRSETELNSDSIVTGWSCLKIQGPLDFSLTGVLAAIAQSLAGANISIFAVSTYDTDHILVKTESLEKAGHVLREAGYTVQQ